MGNMASCAGKKKSAQHSTNKENAHSPEAQPQTMQVKAEDKSQKQISHNLPKETVTPQQPHAGKSDQPLSAQQKGTQKPRPMSRQEQISACLKQIQELSKMDESIPLSDNDGDGDRDDGGGAPQMFAAKAGSAQPKYSDSSRNGDKYLNVKAQHQERKSDCLANQTDAHYAHAKSKVRKDTARTTSTNNDCGDFVPIKMNQNTRPTLTKPSDSQVGEETTGKEHRKNHANNVCSLEGVIESCDHLNGAEYEAPADDGPGVGLVNQDTKQGIVSFQNMEFRANHFSKYLSSENLRRFH